MGWAIALVRYRLEMRIDVLPTGTPMAAAIGTSAVAIAELLIGLSAEPMYNGVTNRGPKGGSRSSCGLGVGPRVRTLLLWPRLRRPMVSSLLDRPGLPSAVPND